MQHSKENSIEVKNEQEIDIMRNAGKILHYIMDEVAKIVTVGLPTIEIDKLARKLIKENGAKPLFLGYKGYPATVCVSVNQEVVHGIPSNRTLKEGDIVSIDIGLQKDGFCTDKAVTFGVGKIDAKSAKLIEVTQNALFRAIDKMRIGNRLGDVCSTVEDYVQPYGFSVVREYTGHGIGRVMHEAPEIPNFGVPRTGPRLVKGMVFALEPMVNIGIYKTMVLNDGWTVVTVDGKNSAHFEDTVVITDDDPEILT